MTKANKAAPLVADAAGRDGGDDSGAARARYEELADLGRDNLAAVLRANSALSKGAAAIGEEIMGYAHRSWEDAAAAARALLAAQTLDDLVRLNTQFAQSSFERMVTRSARLSEMGVKLANEALAPIGDRLEATFHTLAKPVAA